MADAAAKREARRRRILENSENRLKKITGECKDNSSKGKSDSDVDSKLPVENGFITNANDSITNSKVILPEEEEIKELIEKELKLLDSHLQYQKPDNNFASNYLENHYNQKEDKNKCDNSNFHSTTMSSHWLCERSLHFSLYSLFFSSFSCVLLGAFINILFLLNVDSAVYKGIFIPYIVLAITRLCIENKNSESQGNGKLVTAALILCNIKPEIVHRVNKALTLWSTITKELALYLTSFVLFNWIISLCWVDSKQIQFF